MQGRYFVKALVCSVALCMAASLCGCGETGSAGSSPQSKSSAVSSPDESSQGTALWGNDSSEESKPAESSAKESKPSESSKEESEESVSNIYTLGNIIDKGSCGRHVSYQLDEKGLLVISGTFILSGYKQYMGSRFSSSYLKRLTGKDIDVKTVLIEEGVFGIKDFSFKDCDKISSISLPSSLEEIYKGAFEGCTSIQTIVIPDSVTGMGSGVFSGWKPSQTIIMKGKSQPMSDWASDWDKDCQATIQWDG